jgi:hypothetical protein
MVPNRFSSLFQLLFFYWTFLADGYLILLGVFTVEVFEAAEIDAFTQSSAERGPVVSNRRHS